LGFAGRRGLCPQCVEERTDEHDKCVAYMEHHLERIEGSAAHRAAALVVDRMVKLWEGKEGRCESCTPGYRGDVCATLDSFDRTVFGRPTVRREAFRADVLLWCENALPFDDGRWDAATRTLSADASSDEEPAGDGSSDERMDVGS
jgi:hypothetical protein